MRKGSTFTIIGMLFSMFFLGFALSDGLILDRVYVTNSTGIVSTEIIYATPTITFLIISLIIITQIMAILRVHTKRGKGKNV
jgi:hypothetical protein